MEVRAGWAHKLIPFSLYTNMNSCSGSYNGQHIGDVLLSSRARRLFSCALMLLLCGMGIARRPIYAPHFGAEACGIKKEAKNKTPALNPLSEVLGKNLLTLR